MKTAAVAEHYGSAGIAERVLAALRETKGPDAPITPENLAPFDHFHGRGVVATQEIAAQLALNPGERVGGHRRIRPLRLAQRGQDALGDTGAAVMLRDRDRLHRAPPGFTFPRGDATA